MIQVDLGVRSRPAPSAVLLGAERPSVDLGVRSRLAPFRVPMPTGVTCLERVSRSIPFLDPTAQRAPRRKKGNSVLHFFPAPRPRATRHNRHGPQRQLHERDTGL